MSESAMLEGGVPAYLGTPPQAPEVLPPTVTSKQSLPFNDLRWEDFERLVYRLASRNAEVEFCTRYGPEGGKQDGIDLYARARLGKKYWVYQCKRVKNYPPSRIKTAVEEFLKGEWASKCSRFVLCVTLPMNSKRQLNELEKQREDLEQQGIELDWWGQDKLSLLLKENPDLVNDFFGRAWVAIFNGEEASAKLRHHFDVVERNRFRRRFKKFYENVFRKHDPGLPATVFSAPGSASLLKRYVIPDVFDRTGSPEVFVPDRQVPIAARDQTGAYWSDDGRNLPSSTLDAVVLPSQRRSLEDWLSRGTRFLVFGGAGIGKSSMLRYLALDLLEESPALSRLAPKWGSCLPIWMPFGLWTKLISEQTGSAPKSLEEALEAWFVSWSEHDLWQLAKKALNDKRVLLLVDGLDESSSEQAAGLALQLLQVYVEQRNLSIIITTRPQGVQQLGLAQWNCVTGELASLSKFQLRSLAVKWFRWFYQQDLADSSESKTESNNLVEKEADALVVDLERADDLRVLAKNPLLASLLIMLRLRRVRLPANRFQAYESLVEQLLVDHPRRRRQAAFITGEPVPGLTEREFKETLAYLAYHMASQGGSGVASHKEAKRSICEYLCDAEEGLGRSVSEAKILAESIISAGASEIGLLVEVANGEIGFLHRALLQYLAGYHLSRLPEREQLEFIRRHRHDRDWHESIIVLVSLLQRKSDIARVVEEVRLGVKERSDRFLCQLLLAEICFGDFGCPPNIVSSLAEDMFQEIENGPWLTHRTNLIQSAMDGLDGRYIRGAVSKRIKGWLPCVKEFRTDLFKAMGSWPDEDDVRCVLFRGLNDEVTSNQVAAARSLAMVFGGQQDVAEELVNLLCEPYTARRRGPAFLALLEGWLGDSRVQEAARFASRSRLSELQLLSIRYRIHNNAQTEDDLELLLRGFGLHYEWSGMLGPLLLQGWPKSEAVRDTCLSVLRGKQGNIGSSNPIWVLLNEYSDDDTVVEYCLEQIQSERHPFAGYGLGVPGIWGVLAAKLKHNSRIIEAVDVLLEKDYLLNPQKSYAALVGRTERAKACMIHDLDNSSFPFWAANALLEGWGMEDTEVADALGRKARSQTEEACLFAHLFPEILGEDRQCVDRLLDTLRDEDCTRPDFVLWGLERLQGLTSAEEVVPLGIAALRRCRRDDICVAGTVNALLETYPQEKCVRDLACEELMLGDGMHSTVARVYGGDPEIREKIATMATPLPRNLRKIVITRLAKRSATDEVAREILGEYRLEVDPELQTDSAVGYYSAVMEMGGAQEEQVERLLSDVASYGLRFEHRRQAAFAGLVCLERLHEMIPLRETIGENRPLAIGLESWPPNFAIARFIAERFNYISDVLGSDLELRLSRDKQKKLWESLTLVAEGLPEVAPVLKNYWESDKPLGQGAGMLLAIERVWPRSEILLSYCLRCISKENKSRFLDTKSLIAGEIIGRNFSDDQEIMDKLFTEFQEFPRSEPILVALCEGWPTSDCCFRAISVFQETSGYPRPLTSAYLIARMGAPEEVACSLLSWSFYEEAVDYGEDDKYIRKSILRILLRRVAEDEELVDLLKQMLRQGAGFEAANIPALLQLAKGADRGIHDWCRDQLRDPNAFVVDDQQSIATRLRVPVLQALMDVVYGDQSSSGAPVGRRAESRS